MIIYHCANHNKYPQNTELKTRKTIELQLKLSRIADIDKESSESITCDGKWLRIDEIYVEAAAVGNIRRNVKLRLEMKE